MTQITLIQGDITKQRVDVVINAANSSLLGGGGVDGAIHRAGGPEILAECRALRASHYGRGLAVGRAVATTAGLLPAGHVVHTVGPVYGAERYEQLAGLLASCYRESLRLAVLELGARSVAFPAVSTGVYGWPMEDAARIALSTVAEVLAEDPVRAVAGLEVRFVLFGAEGYEIFARVREELGLGSAGGERQAGR
ncbi:O-acetyl-ADP-ribose deacetylase [Kitasatospora sp. NBC_01302]|uniref:O-acetyl-ADP-ribose deacetylase n=1 Tax=Kitasatospora sp. NBC_01302 TaxID=2903575 RepID=UPI002E0DBE8F|nr:O-acetyl-ADP-ribose deacetylase [Kitasatospora sp. NBC_01302]